MTTRNELEKIWSGLYRDEEVRESVEDLLQAELSFEDLVVKTEKELQKVEDQNAVANPTSLGDRLPDLNLIGSKFGEPILLDQVLKTSKLSLFILIRHSG